MRDVAESTPRSSLGDRLLQPRTIWDRVVRWGIFSAALAAIVGVVGAAFMFLIWPLRVIFAPVALALVVVYLLNPLVGRLERRGIRRGFGVAIIYAAFLAVVSVGLSLLIPLIARQISGFIENLPSYVADVTDWVNDFAARRGWDFRIDLSSEQIQQYVSDNRETIIGVLGGVRSFAFGVIHVLITIVIGMILSIYILLDLPKIQRTVRSMLPENRREEIVGLTDKISAALGGFFRGQLLVALFVGVASALGLTFIAKIPFAVVHVDTGHVQTGQRRQHGTPVSAILPQRGDQQRVLGRGLGGQPEASLEVRGQGPYGGRRRVPRSGSEVRRPQDVVPVRVSREPRLHLQAPVVKVGDQLGDVGGEVCGVDDLNIRLHRHFHHQRRLEEGNDRCGHGHQFPRRGGHQQPDVGRGGW